MRISAVVRPVLIAAMFLPTGLTRSAVAALTHVKNVDVRQVYEGEGQNTVHYYLAFEARGGSPTGHAFVTWGQSNQPEEHWGFYPKDTSLPGESAALGGVPGELRDDSRSVPGVTQRLIVRVDEAQYRASRAVLDRYRTRPPLVMVQPGYQLGEKDCINFIYEMGRAFGLAMPDRPLTVLPETYVSNLINEIDKDYTIPLPNGNTYTGQSLIHGDETMGYGWLNGKGVYTSKTGNVISGTFHYGKVEGMGAMQSSDGATFEGNFVDGTPHNGTWREQGQVFSGTKGRGSEPTVGIINFPNGDSYAGNFNRSGQREGQGVYRFKADGSSWDGIWVGDKIGGEVKVKFADGSSAVVSQRAPGYSLYGSMSYTDRNGKTGKGNWGSGGWQVTFSDHGGHGNSNNNRGDRPDPQDTHESG